MITEGLQLWSFRKK